MNVKALESRSTRIAKLRSLRTIELDQLRKKLDSIRQQQQQLEKQNTEKHGRLSQSLGMITHQNKSPGIHCEQIQIAWQFVESLRSDIAILRREKVTLASAEAEVQHQMTVINNQIERLIEKSDHLSKEILMVLQQQEFSNIEDLVSSSWGRQTR